MKYSLARILEVKMGSILPRSLGTSFSFRASLVSEFQKQLAKQEKQDRQLREDMEKAAPKSILDWLVNDSVISTLFQYGRFSANIYFGEYNFINFQDVQRKMSLLRKAWKGVVSVEVRKPETHRVEVYLCAIL